MNPTMTEIKFPIAKGASAIAAGIGANTEAAGNVAHTIAAAVAPVSDPVWYWALAALPWDKIASFIAAIYTSALLCEWLFKKIWRGWLRPIAVRRGWIKGPLVLTESQWAELRKDAP